MLLTPPAHKIIGIDPGLAATGIGLVEGCHHTVSQYAFGCIRTYAGVALPLRLEMIFDRTTTLLETHSPDLMVIEQAFSLERYPKSGLKLGNVIGVLMLAAARANIPCAAVSVKEAKKVLTGSGSADKQQLADAVRHRLGHSGKIRPLHASDALALALIGLYRFDRLAGGAFS